MIIEKPGNILNASEVIIGTPVSCDSNIGRQAASIFSKYSDAENDYRQALERLQAAGISRTMLLGYAALTGQQKDGHIVANIFCQYEPEDCRPDALSDAMRKLADLARGQRWSIALPWSICSRGLSMDAISEIMKDVECGLYMTEDDMI